MLLLFILHGSLEPNPSKVEEASDVKPAIIDMSRLRLHLQTSKVM
jgi:hypothetical protein